METQVVSKSTNKQTSGYLEVTGVGTCASILRALCYVARCEPKDRNG